MEFPEHYIVTAEIERHSAMVSEFEMDGCLACQNGAVKNLRTRGRCKGTGPPPPKPWPPPPQTPPAPPGDSEATQSSQIEGVPPRYVYIHTSLSNSQCFDHDVYAMDCKCK